MYFFLMAFGISWLIYLIYLAFLYNQLQDISKRFNARKDLI